jgi:plastocyanin
MALFRLISAPVALCIVSACSSYTAPSGASLPPPPTANPSADINIVIGASTKTTNAFSPNPKTLTLTGSTDSTVRWINGDISGGVYTMGSATAHQIVSDNGAFASSGSLGGDATYSVKLTTPGDYSYHCGIHPNMVGTIHVNP